MNEITYARASGEVAQQAAAFVRDEMARRGLGDNMPALFLAVLRFFEIHYRCLPDKRLRREFLGIVNDSAATTEAAADLIDKPNAH